MSYYVQRMRDDGRQGWIGPIRTLKQAQKEVAAWEDAGWQAGVSASSPEVRSLVRAWQKKVNSER